MVPCVQKPAGLMVWAAMDGEGKIELQRCPPKVKAKDYQDILEKSFRFIKRRYLPLFYGE